ncbi:ABC transporter permease [Acidobacteriota bacterium]
MFFNYLKITIRNVRRHKVYSFINIAGLAIGIACCILILLWVQDELSYDHFHKNAESLYSPTFSNGSTVTPTALSEYLKAEYPEVMYASRYQGMGRNLLKFGDTEIYQEGGVMVDPDFIRMFTIEFLNGDPELALNDPNSILISKNLAEILFGSRDPIGETVVYNTQIPLKVTGTFSDYPHNSHIGFEFIVPLALSKMWNRDLNTWSVNNIRTYVQLQKGISVELMDEKISGIVEKHRPQDKRPLSLQPVLRLHINPFNHSGGPIIYVYLFTAMAFFILLIACINFINLTTAKSSNRAKEVGIRKTVGAFRNTLIRQFFGESLFLTLIASIMGIGLSLLFLPMFNSLTGKEYIWTHLFNQNVLIGMFGIIIITVIIAGSYPAFILSRFQPVRVLKGKLISGMKGAQFRKALVILQFSLSIFLVLCTLMVYQQAKFLSERDVGYDKDNIVFFGIDRQFTQNSERIKSELLSNPNVLNMTLVDRAPYRWQSNAGFGDVHWEGKTTQQVKMVMICVDYEFLNTFKIGLVDGRFFSKEFSTDPTETFVVNQAAVKAMEMENPVGKQLKVWDFDRRIIGVVKDYHFASLHTEIIPMAMRIDRSWYQQACVRISPQNVSTTLEFIEQKWKAIYPRYPFEAQFLDDTIQNLYRSEQTIGQIVSVFTVLALLISCLGIFGLSSYTAEQRTKEIGIRRVLGASVTSIIRFVSKEFILLVLIANAIVWPVAYILMNLWLKSYAYRINVGLLTFIMTGLAVLLISLLTISRQIYRAATANPADSLRYE